MLCLLNADARIKKDAKMNDYIIRNQALLFDHCRDEGRRCLFLDRDGVINRDFGYVHNWTDIEFLPGVIDVMQHFQELNYLIVIVTNQSGIARGYFTDSQFRELMNNMRIFFNEQNVKLSAVFYCPHHVDGVDGHFSVKCNCRKPLPGLFKSAIDYFKIDVSKSIMVGDQLSDMSAGRLAGISRNFLINSQCIYDICEENTNQFTRIENLNDLISLGGC